jgi:hypothetical protein
LTFLGVQAVGESDDDCGAESESFQDTGDLLVDAKSGFAAVDLPAVENGDRSENGDAAAADGGLQVVRLGAYGSTGSPLGSRRWGRWPAVVRCWGGAGLRGSGLVSLAGVAARVVAWAVVAGGCG